MPKMQKSPEDEYRDAWNESDPELERDMGAEPPPESEDAAVEQAIESVEAEMSADTTGVDEAGGAESAETDGAAETVVLTEGAPDGETPDAGNVEDDEETYRRRFETLKGKYNAETRRKDERIAELEAVVAGMQEAAPQPGGEDVAMLNRGGKACGGGKTPNKVMGYDAGGAVEVEDEAMQGAEAMDDGGEQPEKVDPGPEAKAEGDDEQAKDDAVVEEAVRDIIDELKDEAGAMATDRERLRAVVQQMVDDFGRDHVVAMMATGAPMFDVLAQPHIDSVNSEIVGMAESVQDALRNIHTDRINSRIPGFVEMIRSPEFKEWRAGLSEEDAAEGQRVMQGGQASEVAAFLQKFIDATKGADTETPEAEAAEEPESFSDAWDEDAATAVRSSSPVRLPEKPSASPEDEYLRAWNES